MLFRIDFIFDFHLPLEISKTLGPHLVCLDILWQAISDYMLEKEEYIILHCSIRDPCQ